MLTYIRIKNKLNKFCVFLKMNCNWNMNSTTNSLVYQLFFEQHFCASVLWEPKFAQLRFFFSKAFFFHISVFLFWAFSILLLVSILRANSLSGLSTSRLLAVLLVEMEKPDALKTKQSPVTSHERILLIMGWNLSLSTNIKLESWLISSRWSIFVNRNSNLTPTLHCNKR